MADRCYFDGCDNYAEDDCFVCKQPVCRRHSRGLKNDMYRVCHQCANEALDQDKDADDNGDEDY